MLGQLSQLTHSESISNKDVPVRIIFPHRFVTLDIRNAIIGLDSDFRAKHFVCARSFKSQCNAYFRFTIFLQIRFLSNQLNLYAACTFLSGLKSFKNLDEFSDLTLDFVFYFVSQSSQIFFHQRNWHKND